MSVERLPNRRARRPERRAGLAWRLGAQDRTRRLREVCRPVVRAVTGTRTAASLREGHGPLMHHQLGLRCAVRRCSAAWRTTIHRRQSPNAGVRRRTRRVTRWKDASNGLRGPSAAFLDSREKLPQDHGLTRDQVDARRHLVIPAERHRVQGCRSIFSPDLVADERIVVRDCHFEGTLLLGERQGTLHPPIFGLT